MMSNSGHRAGPLPERWLRCPRFANELLADKFLAFKTPLDEKFNDQVPIQFRFPPSALFECIKNKRPNKIGLWIDLTKTSRFYDCEEVRGNGCTYVKIECHGHDGAPTSEQTETFISLCRMFMKKDPISAIAVHCTHGFNRTGFLIVSFLVQCYDFDVGVAIQQFARVRPPGIYKEEYLKELFKRYSTDDELEIPRAPLLPSWCREEENGSEPTLYSRKKRGPRFKDDPIFMDGVPGVEPVVDRDEVNRIRQCIRTLTNATHDSFIGSQPVSMDRKNIRLLSEKPYRVSWKADGTRYMMYIAGKNEVYFVDRDNSVFRVEKLQFFNRKRPTQHLTNTLLDGEMVIDKDGCIEYPRYLVYDIVYFDGNKITNEPFTLRMRVIELDIVQPRRVAMEKGYIRRELEPFSVRAKQFFELSRTSYLLSEKFARQLTHPPDGLIFQPCNDPYTYGIADTVLKWKPESMNSIDFKLVVKRREQLGCLPENIGDLLTGSGRVFGQIKCNKALRELNNKIIECKLHNNQWVFMRERTDKSFPNADSTAEAVYASIQSPVTQDMLLEYIRDNAWRDPMPPPVAPPPKRQRTS